MVLWIAQGFGVGRIPFAPGTFGTLVGVLWFLILVQTRSLPLVLIGCTAGFGLSVWLCGAAERILGKRDPGSVVLDEITAMPVCFLPWLVVLYQRNGTLPAAEYFLTGSSALVTLLLFAGFRFFDIVKPWPVRQSQALPGGWGVTVDDYLAALWVNVLFLLAIALGWI